MDYVQGVTRRNVIVLTGIAALVLALPALADRRYPDPAGDSPGGADITSVTVSNVAATGTVEFSVHVTNNQIEAELRRGEVSFDVFIDADRNAATGDPHGFDAEVSSDTGVSHWNGTQMSPVSGVFFSGFSSDSFDESVSRQLILLKRANQSFRFVVVSHRTTSTGDIVDTAPNHGYYSYTLAGAPPPPRVVSTGVAVTVTPAAGQLFQVGEFSAGLANNTTAPIKDERCAASIAGTPIAGTGAGHCSFLLPSDASGKQLVVIVSGHYRGHRYKKRLTYRIA
jgi:hypothetical protein